MKIKLSELWNSQNVLKQLNMMNGIPIKTSYWIAKNTKKISKELGTVEEKRKELVSKFGKENENKELSVPQENLEAFHKEFQELLDVEIDVDIKPIYIGEFTLETKLSGQDMIAIDYLFTDEQPASQNKPPMATPMMRGR